MKIDIKNHPSLLTEDTYIFYCSKEDYLNFDNCYNKLPPLQGNERLAYIEYKNKLIDEMREYNQNNHVFMSTPFACDNQWQSNFFIGLENIFRLRELLKRSSPISLFCSDRDWQEVILQEIKKYGGTAYGIKKRSCFSSLLNKLHTIISQLYMCQHIGRYMFRITLALKRRLKNKIKNLEIMFFSTWFPKTLKNYVHDAMDPFFGKIPFLAKKKGFNIGIFCHIEGIQRPYDNAIETENNNDSCIYTYFNFINIFDIFYIIFKVLSERIRFPKDYSYLKKCITKDILKTKWTQSIHALLIKRVTKHLILINPKIRIIHTYEGNCWEKGISMAVYDEGRKHEAKIMGYQHTGFSENFQKLRASEFFFPQKIITTGSLARHILIEKFHHKNESTKSGISLRYPSFDSAHIKHYLPKTFENILVLLQGSPYDKFFLKEVHLFLQGIPTNVNVRPHPDSNVDISKVNKHFLLSTKINLHEELISYDIVLHNGTTAALEASYLGIPTIYLDLGFSFSNNPFFNIENNVLVHQGSEINNFSMITQNIIENSVEFHNHLIAFQKYYNSYFSVPTPNRQNEFLNIITS